MYYTIETVTEAIKNIEYEDLSSNTQKQCIANAIQFINKVYSSIDSINILDYLSIETSQNNNIIFKFRFNNIILSVIINNNKIKIITLIKHKMEKHLQEEFSQESIHESIIKIKDILTL